MRVVYTTLVAALCIAALSCSKKKAAEPFVVIHGDTLRVAQLAEFSPDSLHDTPSLIAAARLKILVDPSQQTDSAETAAADLADLIERESGTKWESPASINLLCGARALAAIEASGAGVAAALDSLGTCIGIKASLPADTTNRLAALLSWLFADPRHAAAVADFLSSESLTTRDASQASRLVAGLVGSGKKAPVTAMTRTTTRVSIADKTGDALKFRSEASIRDTIERHLPFLEGIYRKTLKLDPDMSGIVVVRFTIASTGATTEARVTRTAIARKELLDQIVSYARTIAFSPVPEKAGSMTFEFPFEFHPE